MYGRKVDQKDHPEQISDIKYFILLFFVDKPLQHIILAVDRQ